MYVLTAGSFTAENAIFTREILAKENINTIYLVSKSWHLPRAVEIFEKQGFTVIPAPTGFQGYKDGQPLSFYDFLPAAYAIETNYFVGLKCSISIFKIRRVLSRIVSRKINLVYGSLIFIISFGKMILDQVDLKLHGKLMSLLLDLIVWLGTKHINHFV